MLSQDDNITVPQRQRDYRRNSSVGSIGSGILEDIIEGAVMQEAHKVLGAQFIQEQDGYQSTTSTTTTTTTSSNFEKMVKEKEGGDRKGM